ncbi:uncharacterized protein BCR38DRAFT_487662 [Pseudomassariella vexata]|uniref:Uncharacterized protein n=1 Tax=Pseudomassariella vexata TaxID=1141098 RepID=A0A1Y2DMT3_9PEZI|nr:uncharacterized protein BCR38DRAFT_487662 [Pseudomassariella vexata]ORY60603.1 hypothetical protein BCR38DRAFT_487662 [Pseudomassariella vexata]
MSPESASLFPERPIRPLPKRRLRERLSPDVAEAIKYPPAPHNTAPLFYYPYNLKDEARAGGDHSNVGNREGMPAMVQDGGLRRNLGGELGDDGLMYPARRVALSRPFHDSHSMRTSQRQGSGRHPNPQAPPSTASSADGYDSFENTNNKKKRKIPTAGETALNGAHVLTDASILGIPSPPSTSDEGPGDLATTPYYQSGGTQTVGQGISGPGRGRYGRARNGRSPLRALPDLNTGWAGRNGKLRPGGHYPSSPTGETGIISHAIASAGKNFMPEGQENSILPKQTSTKANTTSAQFTFTFDSQVPGTVSWPGSDPAPSHMMTGNHNQQTVAQSDFRSPHSNTQGNQAGQASLGGSAATISGAPPTGGKQGHAINAPPKKSRRRGNGLLRQAKQRREVAELQNYHHPPAPGDVWICEFCEYERIFGHPPEALIRQYEIKDRKRRREDAQRRRLLEKAKQKSRKGKKASKLPAKNSAPVQDRNTAPASVHQAPNQETQSEEFDEDDCYGDDVHEENCPALVVQNSMRHTTTCGNTGASGMEEAGGGGNYIPVS